MMYIYIVHMCCTDMLYRMYIQQGKFIEQLVGDGGVNAELKSMNRILTWVPGRSRYFRVLCRPKATASSTHLFA